MNAREKAKAETFITEARDKAVAALTKAESRRDGVYGLECGYSYRTGYIREPHENAAPEARKIARKLSGLRKAANKALKAYYTARDAETQAVENKLKALSDVADKKIAAIKKYADEAIQKMWLTGDGEEIIKVLAKIADMAK